MKKTLKINTRSTTKTLAKKPGAARKVITVPPENAGVPADDFSAPIQFREDLFTVVEARFDAGLGNHLFIRGEGAGLSWDKGQPMLCVNGTVWRWAASSERPLVFKVLLNDCIWAAGENLQVSAGDKTEFAPLFM